MNTDIEKYFSNFNDIPLEKLHQIRNFLLPLLPEANERICYGIPTFTLHKNVIHYAAYKNHIGIYPGAKAIAHFKDYLKEYPHSKGAIQFPHNKKIPFNLIKKITLFCIKSQQVKTKPKK